MYDDEAKHDENDSTEIQHNFKANERANVINIKNYKFEVSVFRDHALKKQINGRSC